MFIRMIFFNIFYILVCMPVVAGAQGGAQDGEGNAYHIKADSLAFDDVTGIYRARGNASVLKGGQTLVADAVDFNDRTKEASAWGNARFSSGGDWVTGSRIDLNLQEETGTVYQGTLFIEKSHFYVRGQEIVKTGKDSYFIKGRGSLTACDDEWPAWEITGKDCKVTLEGYGTIKHPALRVKSVPVLYAPFMLFPAKIKRQSGLLVPLIGYSEKNGFSYNQPYFWAIRDNADATFYEHYMAHRGFQHGVEARYVRSVDEKATAMYDYLWDEQIDDGTESTDTSGYHYEGFRGDDENRLNRKRWWFRTKADWDMPSEFQAMLDMDVVSDQDYLREFESGYSGYDQTNKYFLQEFNRELDDSEETVRLSQININRSWRHFSLNTGAQWFDDVILRNQGGDDDTLQRLPFVTLFGSKQRIEETPFYFDVSSGFQNYWSETGTKGYQLDAAPRAYYPLTVFNVFDFEPSAGFRETVWQVDRFSYETDQDRLASREILDLEGDLSTELSRIFKIENSSIDKIRHAVRPQVVYTYIPDVEQGNLPQYVSAVEEENLLTYSVTNTLTSRGMHQLRPGAKKAPHLDRNATKSGKVRESHQADKPLSKYVYHDFCRFTVSQSYDLLDARRPSEDGEERRPFSDVSGRLEFSPFHDTGLDFVGNVEWSPYTGDYTSYDARSSFNTTRGDEISMEYRYTRDNGESLLGKCYIVIVDTLAIFLAQENNLEEAEVVESETGFIYAPQCWSFTLTYTHDRSMNERQYMFQISLFGLGEYGLGGYRPDTGSDTWMKKG